MAREVITIITTILPTTITTARHIIQADILTATTVLLTARVIAIIITATAPRLQ